MKERPILFNGPMVKAVLDDSKTQTRRVVKPQPVKWFDEKTQVFSHWTQRNGYEWVTDAMLLARCPYGQSGDRLWVRETWAPVYKQDGCRDADGLEGLTCPCGGCTLEYKADTGNKYPGEWDDDKGDDPMCGRWKPSIHMPRWASRIDLEVTGVRVERVREIGEEDARAEGVIFDGTYWLGGIHPVKETLQCWPSAKRAFQALWDSIYRSTPGRRWDDNPWVWVVEFKKL